MGDKETEHVESNIANVYRTRDMADLLKISTSSIRKYAIALEAAGVTFNHDEKGERLYDERDFKAFSHMRQLVSKGSTMKEAATQAGSLLQGERQVRREAGEVLIRSDRDLIVVMAKKIDALTKENVELRASFGKLSQQNSQILASLNRLEALAEDAAEAEEERQANDVRTPPSNEKSSGDNEKAPEPKRGGLLGRLFGKR